MLLEPSRECVNDAVERVFETTPALAGLDGTQPLIAILSEDYANRCKI